MHNDLYTYESCVLKTSMIKQEIEEWISNVYPTSISNTTKVEIGIFLLSENGINNIQEEFIHAAFLIKNKYYFLSFDWDKNFDISLPNTYPWEPLSISLKSKSTKNVKVL